LLQQKTNKYLETAVLTATPQQLMMMLYDGAIRFCKIGIESIKQNNYTEANKNLLKCQDIIREFLVTIDRGSEVADGLVRLYDYFIFRLIEANTQKSVEPAEEVLSHLIELKITWLQAIKDSSSSSSAGVKHG
jgi:flagellar protein FliS